MSQSLLSVIIPIYNAEEFLVRCLNSVVNQTYQELEIILINDGSTDNSRSICEEYARIDSRILLLNKKNGGQSSARNAGLDIARGDYITFVDSDDYIDSDTYAANMDYLIKNKHIEILQFPFRGNNNTLRAPKQPYLISGEENIFANWWTNNIITSAVWDKIFQKKIFEKIRFPLGQIFEDHFLIVDFSEAVDNVYLSNRGCYNYIIRENSTTTSTVTFAKCIDFFKAHKKVYEKLFYYEDLKPYRLIAFSRVYRKLITARRINSKADLSPYIQSLEKLIPEWGDIFHSKSGAKERIWFVFVKILGLKNFMNMYTQYLDYRNIRISS